MSFSGVTEARNDFPGKYNVPVSHPPPAFPIQMSSVISAALLHLIRHPDAIMHNATTSADSKGPKPLPLITMEVPGSSVLGLSISTWLDSLRACYHLLSFAGLHPALHIFNTIKPHKQTTPRTALQDCKFLLSSLSLTTFRILPSPPSFITDRPLYLTYLILRASLSESLGNILIIDSCKPYLLQGLNTQPRLRKSDLSDKAPPPPRSLPPRSA